MQFDDHDAVGPLPGARLDGIYTTGRRDLTLNGVPLQAWTREALREWLAAQGAAYQEERNGWLSTGAIWFGFDDAGCADRVWV